MGNEASQEEDDFYNTEYEEPLDSPRVDEAVNAGTTAANCQPKHTRRAAAAEREQENSTVTEGERAADAKYRRDSSSGSMHTSGGSTSERRRSTQSTPKQEQKKPSYIQMAKMGYQELVNAIIRPPRADYKVRKCMRS